MERIEVDEEKGLIRQAQMTSSGFADALRPGRRIQAAWAYRVDGGAFFTERQDGHPMVHVAGDCSASYRYFDFGDGGHIWRSG